MVPALAERVLAVRDGRADVIPVGNLDVRRDLLHVDDVVVAYRLLLESLAAGRVRGAGSSSMSPAAGRSPSATSSMACSRGPGPRPRSSVDARFVRANDPPEIRGDAGRLRALTGWQPQRDLETILDDVWADVAGVGEPDMTWIIMPTFNERANVETIVPAIRSALPDATLLIVDDSSPDGTGEVADALAAADAAGQGPASAEEGRPGARL